MDKHSSFSNSNASDEENAFYDISTMLPFPDVFHIEEGFGRKNEERLFFAAKGDLRKTLGVVGVATS